MRRQVVLFLLAALVHGVANSQSAIQLEPFPATSYSPKPKVDITTVHNYYGRCGSAVVQVLGVARDDGDFYSVDGGSAEGASVVVIAPGGRNQVTIKDALSDYNGVACVTKHPAHYVLIWSNCGGTACGDDFNFTVVDVKQLRVIAGGRASCDEVCATRITGSALPMKLNRH